MALEMDIFARIVTVNSALMQIAVAISNMLEKPNDFVERKILRIRIVEQQVHRWYECRFLMLGGILR